MSKKRDAEQIDLDLVEADVSRPVRLRRELRGGTTRSRSVSRRKASTSRRKVNKPGGIHQRANKRMSW